MTGQTDRRTQDRYITHSARNREFSNNYATF